MYSAFYFYNALYTCANGNVNVLFVQLLTTISIRKTPGIYLYKYKKQLQKLGKKVGTEYQKEYKQG